MMNSKRISERQKSYRDKRKLEAQLAKLRKYEKQEQKMANKVIIKTYVTLDFDE